MKQIKLYTSLLTENGDIVFVIPFVKEGETKDMKILYDGHEHALFYHSNGEVFILDYLNEAIQVALRQVKKVFVFEVDLQKQIIVNDYEVPVFITEQLPSIQLEQKLTS